MSEEIIDRLRAGLDAFNQTGEIESDLLDPNLEMHQASSIIDTAGVFHGRDGLRAALRELQEAFDDLSFEPEKIIETPGGELVAFIRVRGRGRGSGMEMDNAIAWVVALRDDKIVRIVVYEERADALEAAGLSE
jgi:ketosteroid isomerase-like protein